MKIKVCFALSVLVLCLCGLHAGATIWRVNNYSNYNGTTLWGENFGGSAAYPVFTQVNQAVSFGIVSNGDTIHVEGSTLVYDQAVIRKRLVLIGTGFFLTDNPNTGSNILESRTSRIIFASGAQGSQAIGLSIVNDGSSSDGVVYVDVDDITVKRCRIERSVAFETLLSDIVIVQNFFPNTYNTNCLATNGFSSFIPPVDLIFNNNICQKTLTWGTPLANPTTYWPMLQCRNNVFDGPDNHTNPNIAFSTSDFSNNILMPTNAVAKIVASAGVVKNNIGSLSTQFGSADGNLVVPAINTLFVTTTSRDGAYQVKDGTVADNSGTDGTDRGAYGGIAVINRYTLSGLAPIPVVYDISTSGVADASGLPVTIKARTIK